MKEVEIKFTDLTRTAIGEYCAEASSLGLKPGRWPKYIYCLVSINMIDPWIKFRRQAIHIVEDVQYVVYTSANQTLTIFND